MTPGTCRLPERTGGEMMSGSMIRCPLVWVCLAVAGLVAETSFAQKLPAPSGTAYKCEADGKITYSDAPCLGATRVDTTPTRGVNRATGTLRMGSDVRQEMHDEQMAEALRPLTGQSAEQWRTAKRRSRLPAETRARCTVLDHEIASTEWKEERVSGSARDAAQKRLLKLRQTYFDLQC